MTDDSSNHFEKLNSLETKISALKEEKSTYDEALEANAHAEQELKAARYELASTSEKSRHVQYASAGVASLGALAAYFSPEPGMFAELASKTAIGSGVLCAASTGVRIWASSTHDVLWGQNDDLTFQAFFLSRKIQHLEHEISAQETEHAIRVATNGESIEAEDLMGLDYAQETSASLA